MNRSKKIKAIRNRLNTILSMLDESERQILPRNKHGYEMMCESDNANDIIHAWNTYSNIRTGVERKARGLLTELIWLIDDDTIQELKQHKENDLSEFLNNQVKNDFLKFIQEFHPKEYQRMEEE